MPFQSFNRVYDKSFHSVGEITGVELQSKAVAAADRHEDWREE
jgi:hypothetical protein